MLRLTDGVRGYLKRKKDGDEKVKYILVLLLMILMHIFADYHLQGILASMKQKSWWLDQCKADYEKYRNDYKAALIAHSFEWSFLMMVPIFILKNPMNYSLGDTVHFLWMLILNVFIHAITDHAKANLHTFNLIQDQAMHYFQIVFTWMIFVIHFADLVIHL